MTQRKVIIGITACRLLSQYCRLAANSLKLETVCIMLVCDTFCRCVFANWNWGNVSVLHLLNVQLKLKERIGINFLRALSTQAHTNSLIKIRSLQRQPKKLEFEHSSDIAIMLARIFSLFLFRLIESVFQIICK